ncbi:MAG TPA: DUF1040 family protein [bacterium]|nr:DUF1040 family protein [bacterium]
MRDPERIDKVLAIIRRTWKAYPDLRLGQLLLNVVQNDLTSGLLYYMEDEELIGRIIQLYGDIKI